MTNESSPPSLIGRHVTAAALRLPGVPHPASRVRVVQPNRFAIPPIRRFTALPSMRNDSSHDAAHSKRDCRRIEHAIRHSIECVNEFRSMPHHFIR
ncbi:hypothetical protein [Burkholderia pseudomallei]|uniref:hypothetical protein n=1 Tax=Burkholderia pseudomallei TaxID=28450 RepID=UPI0015C35299|nr:hypothetical protein [Burkholderia pseudomallei]